MFHIYIYTYKSPYLYVCVYVSAGVYEEDLETLWKAREDITVFCCACYEIIDMRKTVRQNNLTTSIPFCSLILFSTSLYSFLLSSILFSTLFYYFIL